MARDFMNVYAVRYIREDARRIGEAYGLSLKLGATVDTDWMRTHAAYLQAADAGRGDAFGRRLFAARFCEACDVASDEVLGAAARASELDPGGIVRAADDPAVHARVRDGVQSAFAGGLFGVPTFVYRGAMFWGNDRIDWLRRAIERDLGRPVENLRLAAGARA